jgi:hypothetical protein
MAGLRKLCKIFGGVTVTGDDGKTIKYVWDYAADKPATEAEMPFGSKRHAASERAKSVIACLGDDAALLRHDNPHCEIAENMDAAADMLEKMRRALHDVAEEWAGAECGEPVHAQEAYAIGLAKRMYALAVEGLGPNELPRRPRRHKE